MEIIRDDKAHVLEIWLTQKECEDTTLRRSLLPMMTQYKEKKYKSVIFMSGKRDIEESAKDLLVHNLHVLAKKC